MAFRPETFTLQLRHVQFWRGCLSFLLKRRQPISDRRARGRRFRPTDESQKLLSVGKRLGGETAFADVNHWRAFPHTGAFDKQ